MNCNKCLDKCKAVCCGIIPFDRKFIAKNKPLRKVVKEIDMGEEVILETEGLRCPYLSEQFTCTIYNKRPEVCKLYGNETQINLTCQYQDKDGRIRSRQERRNIERHITKFIDAFIRQRKNQP
jgi:Fe-S-cluster containining protein